MVEDPLYHQTFDLTPLRNHGTKDYEVAGPDGDTYAVNVCGDLRLQTGDCGEGVGACHHHGDDVVPIGESHKLYFLFYIF